MTPTSNVLARNRLPTDATAAFYEARAAGGVGMIVSEGLRVHPTNCNPTSIGTFVPEVVNGLSRIAERVHAHGVTLIGQIMHGGRQSHQRVPHLLWAPSAVPCLYSGYVPHAMTTAEVEEMREHFLLAAIRVQDAGWDGVELHAAQGHLVQQFLSPLSNVRTDRYGGDFERRLTFALEVLDRIRARCGESFIVGLRIASSEFVAGGIDLDDAIAISQAIESRTSIDYVSVAQANFMSIAAHIPDRREPPLTYLDQDRRLRAALERVPLIASARIRTPAEAESMLEQGAGDMIGLTRALVADPDWVRKARGGEAERIRQCIYCNVCWHTITSPNAILCVQNPAAGRELELPAIEPASAAKRVIVIGGGPAGMAAAEAAARRGHRVTLYEQRDHLGGQLNVAAQVPGDEEIAHVVRHLKGELARLGVKVRLGLAAGAETMVRSDVVQSDADVVIVATGSAPPSTVVLDGVSVPVYSAVAAIEQRESASVRDLRRVMLLDRDGYFATYALAEMLAQRGVAVQLVSFHTTVGHDLPLTNLTQILGRLDRLGVELFAAHDLVRANDHELVLRHVYSQREKRLPAVDAIVVSGAHRANDALGNALKTMGLRARIEIIGDALAPRAIKDAIHEGHRAGRAV